MFAFVHVIERGNKQVFCVNLERLRRDGAGWRRRWPKKGYTSKNGSTQRTLAS